jgi:DNA-binding Lrp family transcriptional regulator
LLKACILLKTVPTKADDLVSALKKMECVKKAYLTYGRYDLAAFLQVEDYQSLRRATSEIGSLDGVRSTETLSEA